jgi:uncharacterized repeat protein (TIGR02543 family)
MKKSLLVVALMVCLFWVTSCAGDGASINGDPSPYYNSVIFDPCGGHINGNYNIRYTSADNGRPIPPDEFPKDPQRGNDTFDGWFTEKYGIGNKFTKSTRVYTSFTVYAHWIMDK